jgi:hypothetical protein
MGTELGELLYQALKQNYDKVTAEQRAKQQQRARPAPAAQAAWQQAPTPKTIEPRPLDDPELQAQAEAKSAHRRSPMGRAQAAFKGVKRAVTPDFVQNKPRLNRLAPKASSGSEQRKKAIANIFGKINMMKKKPVEPVEKKETSQGKSQEPQYKKSAARSLERQPGKRNLKKY